MTEQEVIEIMFKHFPTKMIPTYSSLRHHQDSEVKSCYNFFEKNGRKNYCIKLLSEHGFDFSQKYYLNDKNEILRSEYEFYLWSIFHFNNIPYHYEPKNIKGLLPDFYLPENDLYVELYGLCGQFDYDKKTKQKKLKYENKGLKSFGIYPKHHDPYNSIFNQINELFNNQLNEPNFYDYCKNYMINFDTFLENVKKICIELQNGEFKTPNDIGKKYSYTYDRFVSKSYGSWRWAVISLLDEIPSQYVNTSNGYYTDEVIQKELEMCKSKLGIIPNKLECEELHKLGETCINVVIYLMKQYRLDCFCKGGKYCGWIPYYENSLPSKNKKFTLSKSKINQINKLYDEGFGLIYISNKFGISMKKVRQYIPNDKIRKNIKLNSEKILEMHRLFHEEKIEPKEISKMFNIQRDSIYPILRGVKWKNEYKKYHAH